MLAQVDSYDRHRARQNAMQWTKHRRSLDDRCRRLRGKSSLFAWWSNETVRWFAVSPRKDYLGFVSEELYECVAL